MVSRPSGSGAFAATLDVRLLAAPAEGEAALEIEATDAHLNANGIVHGGVLMSILDMAMATSVTATLAPAERAASITIQTSFLKAAKVGRLVATGRVLKRGRTAAFAEGEIRDAAGAVIAKGNGIWAVTPRL